MAHEENQRLYAAYIKLDDKLCETGKAPLEYKTAKHLYDRQAAICSGLEDRIIAARACTMDGLIGKARCLNANLIDGETVSDDPDAEFGASLVRDLLAMRQAPA